MTSSSLRFGLEIELHGFLLTFVDDQHKFCPAPPERDRADQYMIGLENILVPVVTDGVFMDENHKIHWETNEWGFRAVADAHQSITVNKQSVFACIIELATAAAPVDDYHYWINSRKHAKKIVEIMNRWMDSKPPHKTDGTIRVPGPTKEILDTLWYPLQDFLDVYNSSAEQNSFHLKKSDEIVKFEQGTHHRSPGKKWHAHVSFRSVKGTAKPIPNGARWADVQVNYQLNVSDLYQRTDDWINSWGSIWAQKVQNLNDVVTIDDDVGDTARAVTEEFYKVQVYAAMWRLAKAKVDEYYRTGDKTGGSRLIHKVVTGEVNQSTTQFPPHKVETRLQPQVKALLMYLIVACSINNKRPGVDRRVEKNFYPQLPKTSPASIRSVIENLDPNTKDHFKSLIQTGPLNAAKAAVAALHKSVDLEKIGKLPNKNLRSDLDRNRFPNYASPTGLDFTGGMAKVTIGAQTIEKMWKGGLDATLQLKPENSMGFTEKQPFFLSWAEEVNSSYPARATDNKEDIRVLFESRYGRSVLNIGFNPYIKDALFNRSYLKIVRLCGRVTKELQNAVDAAYPDNPSFQQKLGGGIH